MSPWGNYSRFSEVFLVDQYFVPKRRRECAMQQFGKQNDYIAVKCFVSFSGRAHSFYVLLMNLRDANRNVRGLVTTSISQQTRCLFSLGIYGSHWHFQSVIAASFWTYKHHSAFACFNILFVTCTRHYYKLFLWYTAPQMGVSNAGLNLSAFVNYKPSCT